jgi:hypothetical protein
MQEADAAARAVLRAGLGDDLHILVKRHQALDGIFAGMVTKPHSGV